MARQLRNQYQDAVYHVTVRRQEGADLFYSDEDYLRLLTLLSEAKKKYEVSYLAFCLMGNHYHLLIKTPMANLSQAMHWVNTSYSTFYNWRYDHQGHVLQGRFHCQEVNQESYLLEVSRYIHLNPVRAQMVNDPLVYRYSSLSSYLGQSSLMEIDTSLILGCFENDGHSYVRFVNEGINIYKSGEKNSIDWQLARQIIDKVCEENDISVNELLLSKTMVSKKARNTAVIRIANETQLCLKDIGTLTGLSSPGSVHRIICKQ